MLQLVADGRGVSAVPNWIIREEGADMPMRAVRCNRPLDMGLYIGLRKGKEDIAYIKGFLDLACELARQAQ